MSRDISKSIKSKLSPLNCPITEYTIIMSDPFAPVKINTTKYEGKRYLDGDLYKDLADLGWEYTSGRMSRSGMFYYDQIMTRLGILENGEHWNEDVYQDHNCDH